VKNEKRKVKNRRKPVQDYLNLESLINQGLESRILINLESRILINRRVVLLMSFVKGF